MLVRLLYASRAVHPVTADVIGPVKGPKIDTYKYKRRKGYSKKIGHRQQYTAVKVTGINV